MKDKGGFLLLEVLLAMAILSAGIVVVMAVFSSCVRAAGISERRFIAGLEAERKTFEFEAWGLPKKGPREWREHRPLDPKQTWRMWELNVVSREVRGEVFTMYAVVPK